MSTEIMASDESWTYRSDGSGLGWRKRLPWKKERSSASMLRNVINVSPL
jgi:hypothetical protein